MRRSASSKKVSILLARAQTEYRHEKAWDQEAIAHEHPVAQGDSEGREAVCVDAASFLGFVLTCFESCS
jgi:hypothetical protein